jgi:2-amino-4-hydroxy-6-hydroxymethyldihydropteridine diphosphokinase
VNATPEQRAGTRVFVGVAANIQPEKNIMHALKLLGEQIEITGISTFYRTMPIGRPEQPPYLNGVLEAYVHCSPRDLKCGVLREIERQLGRIRSEDKYAARPIDLDLLMFGEEAFAEEDLAVPDPDLCERAFLAAGVKELAPGLRLPGAHQPIDDLLCEECARLEPVHGFQQRLKEMLHL